MIIGYDLSTLEAASAILDESDSVIQDEFLIGQLNEENIDAFILADDQAVVDKIFDYLITATANELITFESPTYTAGDVDTKDGWAKTALHIAGSLDVNTTNPIVEAQDLKYNSSTSGITHYRRPVVSNAGGAYTAKWLFRNSANLGASNEVVVAMANSADTDGARAWVCKIKGNGDVVFTDNSGDTTFPGVALSTTRKILYTVKVKANGSLYLIIDRLFRMKGTIISGNQTIDRWLVSGGPNNTTNADTGRWDQLRYTIPTAVQRKKSILVTPLTDPMELNETSQLSIQLRQANLANDNVVKTVTLRASDGVIVPSQVQTNGSGFSDEAIYKPAKDAGAVSIVASTDEHTQLISEGGVFITANTPTNSSEQEWLETEDIKADSITFDKQSSKGQVRIPGLHPFYFVSKAFLAVDFDVSLQNINSIIADDAGNLYVNGFDGPGATNPVVKKVDKQTGAVLNTYTIPAGEENLANRFDGMAYSGAFLWVAGANHLLKLNLDMTLATDFTIAADGNIQFVASDGEFIWFHLRGGTDADKDKIWKFNPITGLKVTAINYRAGDTIDPSIPREIKQVAMDDQFMYITGTGSNSDWDRMDRTTHALDHRNDSDLFGAFGIAVDNLIRHIYLAGGSAGGEDQLFLDNAGGLPRGIAANDTIDNFLYDLFFDGIHIWLITSPTSGARRYVRKIKFNPIGPTLDVIQSFDIGIAVDPTALAFDGQYLYVAAFAATAINITKIGVGK